MDVHDESGLHHRLGAVHCCDAPKNLGSDVGVTSAARSGSMVPLFAEMLSRDRDRRVHGWLGGLAARCHREYRDWRPARHRGR